MEAAPGLEVAIAAARTVEHRFLDASDEQLVAALRDVETLGRLADGLRIAVAAEAEARSDARRGEGRLAFRNGARDGVELVRQAARIPHREAKRRVALGAALAPVRALTGEPLPGRHPDVAAAIRDGRIGVESARAIVNAVKQVRLRADAADLATMVDGLVGTAEAADTETVHDAAAMWVLALDPDGVEPKERDRQRARALRIGRTLLDGTTTVSMVVPPELLVRLQQVLRSRRHGAALLRTEPGGDADATTEGPEWREQDGPDGADPRTRQQQDLDSLFEVLEAGMAAETMDTATAVTHETVVTITAAELEARRGQAWAPGILAGLPIPVVERQACAGGVRLLVTGLQGEPLHLGRRHRLFSPAQRRALTVAAGGRCQVPGCRTPAPYLEAHHARWWDRDGGRTDVGNGIMLCSFHHHLVHAVDSPIEIRHHRGDLYVVPHHWLGPPDPSHRRQRGWAQDPRAA